MDRSRRLKHSPKLVRCGSVHSPWARSGAAGPGPPGEADKQRVLGTGWGTRAWMFLSSADTAASAFLAQHGACSPGAAPKARTRAQRSLRAHPVCLGLRGRCTLRNRMARRAHMRACPGPPGAVPRLSHTRVAASRDLRARPARTLCTALLRTPRAHSTPSTHYGRDPGHRTRHPIIAHRGRGSRDLRVAKRAYGHSTPLILAGATLGPPHALTESPHGGHTSVSRPRVAVGAHYAHIADSVAARGHN